MAIEDVALKAVRKVEEKETTQRLLTCPMCEIMDEGDRVDYTGYKNFHLQVALDAQGSTKEGQ